MYGLSSERMHCTPTKTGSPHAKPCHRGTGFDNMMACSLTGQSIPTMNRIEY